MITLECPFCGHSLPITNESEVLTCPCGAKYKLQKQDGKVVVQPIKEMAECPICGSVNQFHESFHCRHCNRTHLCEKHKQQQNFRGEYCMSYFNGIFSQLQKEENIDIWFVPTELCTDCYESIKKSLDRISPQEWMKASRRERNERLFLRILFVISSLSTVLLFFVGAGAWIVLPLIVAVISLLYIYFDFFG